MNFRNFDIVVSHHPWAIRGFALGLALFAAGCPADEGAPDGGLDAGVEDAWMPWDGGRFDSGVPRTDELDASEPTDLGACSCTYGFHHQCAPSEVCAAGFAGDALCRGPTPHEQVVTSCFVASSDGSGICNAQCVPGATVSPCAGELLSNVGGHLERWFSVLNSWNPDDGRNYENDPMPFIHAIKVKELQTKEWGSDISRQCGEFIAWTALGVIRLCRGEAAIDFEGDYRSLGNWRFSLAVRNDPCSSAAYDACVSVLETATYDDGPSFDSLSNIAPACPSGLPMASPCDGEDALVCLMSRLSDVATTLRLGTKPRSP